MHSFAFVMTLALASTFALAASNITITPDFSAPRVQIPEDFTGVSFEVTLLLSNDGKYYFRPDNQPLIGMFKALGIHNLRVGGNMTDKPGNGIPQGADIDNFFAFADKVDVKVIYTLRLREQQTPDADVAIAKYLYDHYAPQISYLTIGNEPNVYLKEYPAYKAQLVKFINAIAAVAPDAKFCGPSTTPSHADWARNLANDLGDDPHFRFLTQHSYPGGAATKVPDGKTGRDRMLSPLWVADYQKFYDSFVPAAIEHRLQYRLEETNSYFNGGLQNASDTYAASLWALDYMYWWAAHGADGMNFHTGDFVAKADTMVPCRYAVFTSTPTGYEAHPVGYAIKAFDVGGHGSIVPLNIDNADKANVTAYSVISPDSKNLFVTIINKEHDDGARDAMVSLETGAGWTDPVVMDLAAPKNDVAATTGLTLGGASINDDGKFTGQWSPLSFSTDRLGEFAFPVPASRAVIVKFTAH